MVKTFDKHLKKPLSLIRAGGLRHHRHALGAQGGAYKAAAQTLGFHNFGNGPFRRLCRTGRITG